jgi:hypothetical protein
MRIGIMRIYNPKGVHERFTETNRHFSPASEHYTGADSLLTAQRYDWRLVNIAYEDQVQMRGGRFTSLYYFKLIRNNETMIMPILSNPFVLRMLEKRRMIVRALPLARMTDTGEFSAVEGAAYAAKRNQESH